MYDMGGMVPKRKQLKDAEDKNSGVSEVPIHSVLSKPRNVSNVVPAQLMTVLEQVSCLGLALDRQNSFKGTEIGRQEYIIC